METISKISYKTKVIIYCDYSSVGKSKEQTLKLINGIIDEYKKYPLKSVLALINVTNLHFDMDILNLFKESQAKSAPYAKKEAIVGINGLQKVAYNFIAGMTNNKTMKAFDTELEAKEWLAAD